MGHIWVCFQTHLLTKKIKEKKNFLGYISNTWHCTVHSTNQYHSIICWFVWCRRAPNRAWVSGVYDDSTRLLWESRDGWLFHRGHRNSSFHSTTRETGPSWLSWGTPRTHHTMNFKCCYSEISVYHNFTLFYVRQIYSNNYIARAEIIHRIPQISCNWV